MNNIVIADKMGISIPSNMVVMTNKQKEFFYGNIHTELAYTDENENFVICAIINSKENDEPKGEKRVIQYYQLYRQLVPGFKKGDILYREEENYNIGVMSYQSNSLRGKLYNVIAIVDDLKDEYVISMSCGMNISYEKIDVM